MHPAATLGISDSGVWARIGEIEGYHSQLATALAGLDKGLSQTLVRLVQLGRKHQQVTPRRSFECRFRFFHAQGL